MIYVNKDTINVEIPKSGNIGEARQIRLLNLLTNIDIYTEIEDLGNDPIVYIFNIESIVKDLVVGLYDYFVLDVNGSVLDNGILQCDSFNSEVGAYSLDDPKMIQYSLGGAYTPIPETIFTIFENGVYDTIGIDKVIVKVQGVEPDEPVDYPNYLVFTNTNQVTINNNLNSSPNLEYSFDRDNWVTIEFPQDTSILDIATDDKPIYFRGDNPDGFDNNVLGNKFLTFVSDGEVGGNIMSILDPTCESVTLPNSYCFGRLFYGSRITSAANLILPADLLVSNAYYLLFCNCANLTQVPELPATTLADNCYSYMFLGCTSLTHAPELPATTLAEYCYRSMFNSCIILTQAPELPATTLVKYCYFDMFTGCKALTQAPELPATTLAEGCYAWMFLFCISLNQAPKLPAKKMEVSCYTSMFNGCVSLLSPPQLPATVLALWCYQNMFRGCTSLASIPRLPALNLEDSCYAWMFAECKSLTVVEFGYVVNLSGGCYQNMFYNCTALNSVSGLDVTTLSEGCYSYMFYGCTSLTKAPELPATTLVPHCYEYMFYGCSALTSIECMATDISASESLTDWTYGVAETGTFKKSAGVEWPTGYDGIPSRWSVVEL